MPQDSGNLWIWRRFALTLPSDWEMLQFSRREDQGRCAFADRARYRLEFCWRAVEGPPDFDRMLRDYAARLSSEGGAQLTAAAEAGWRGWRGTVAGTPQWRLGRYFPGQGCLVECVFPRPGPDGAVERAVLASVREESGSGDCDRWRAFGLDVAAPRGALLEAAQAAAGDAELAFRHGGGRLRARRLGMLEAWFDGDVGGWLRCRTPAGFRVLEEAHRSIEGHAIHRLRAARAWGRRLFRPHDGDAVLEAWVCHRDGRLYFLERRQAWGAPLAQRENGFGAVLACCTVRGESVADRGDENG